MLKYSDIIKTDRRRPSEFERQFLADETESDRARLIFSSPFRRLQQKAQVFSLESNSTVRSRLTHSLEVANLGRTIAKKILYKLDEKEKETYEINTIDIQQAFIDLVETACLMHDIGNPPFGHFGEQAIQKWFKENAIDIFKDSLLRDETLNENDREICIGYFRESLLYDFLEFDGNAQGFRIVSCLQWNKDQYSLNLTNSLLATFLKYLRKPCKENKDKEHFKKKPGFFASEEKYFQMLWKGFNLKDNQRFPLNFIMESADDIAYCISDIEDGIEKKIISHDFVAKGLIEEWEKITGKKDGFIPELIKKHINKDNFYFEFKISLSIKLIQFVVDQYCKFHKDIMDGNRKMGLFDEDCDESNALEALKIFSRKHLFSDRGAENIELAGYAIITGLLEKFSSLLKHTNIDFDKILNDFTRTSKGERTDLERRLFHRLSKKYVKHYTWRINCLDKSDDKFKANEWYHRAHLIVDHISGMTDNHALKTYQLLSGINVK